MEVVFDIRFDYRCLHLLVFAISGAINRLSLSTATLLFIIYSVLNGAMLSSIFVIYEPMVIAKVFFITAGKYMCQWLAA